MKKRKERPRKAGSPKQSTRLIKAACGDCGYTIRVTQKWLEQGNPGCPCGGVTAPEGGDDDEGGEE